MRNAQVLLPQEDDDLVGVLSLKLVDVVDEVAVTVFAKVLGAQVQQPMFGLDEVDAGIAHFQQLLHEKHHSAMFLRKDCRCGCRRHSTPICY